MSSYNLSLAYNGTFRPRNSTRNERILRLMVTYIPRPEKKVLDLGTTRCLAIIYSLLAIRFDNWTIDMLHSKYAVASTSPMAS